MNPFEATRSEYNGGRARAKWTIAETGGGCDYPQISGSHGRYSFTIWLGGREDAASLPDSIDDPMCAIVYWGNWMSESPGAMQACSDNQSLLWWQFDFASGTKAMRFAEGVAMLASLAHDDDANSDAERTTFSTPNIFTILQEAHQLREEAESSHVWGYVGRTPKQWKDYTTYCTAQDVGPRHYYYHEGYLRQEFEGSMLTIRILSEYPDLYLDYRADLDKPAIEAVLQWSGGSTNLFWIVSTAMKSLAHRGEAAHYMVKEARRIYTESKVHGKMDEFYKHLISQGFSPVQNRQQ